MTPETTQGWLDLLSEEGFMKVLAIIGMALPYIGYYFLYRLARYGIDKCKDVLESIDKKLEEHQ